MNEALDTSVVLRLLTGEPPEQCETARRYLEQSGSPLSVHPIVVGESYFALRHHYTVPHVHAVDALLALLSSAHITSGAEVRAALSAVRDEPNPGVIDRLILAAAKTQEQVLLTFDRQLGKLEGARTLR